MKLVNIDEFISMTESPKLVIGGKEYSIRPLSFRDAVKFQKRLSELDTSNMEELEKLITDICEAGELPTEKILSLPPNGVNKIIESFFTFILGTGE